jgi:hypothetical protein
MPQAIAIVASLNFKPIDRMKVINGDYAAGDKSHGQRHHATHQAS